MEAKYLLYASIVGLLLAVWMVNSAPIDTLSDEEHLKRTLSKLDSVLDELIQRTQDSHTSYSKRNEDGSIPYKRNEDGSLPYKRNEDGSLPYKRNEDGSLPYKRNEDGSLPYKRNEDIMRRQGWIKSSNPDGPVPYRTLKRGNEDPEDFDKRTSEVNAQSGTASENNLRKVLRYLADMEQKLQKRDHDPEDFDKRGTEYLG